MTTAPFRDRLAAELRDPELSAAYAAECQCWQRQMPRRFAWLSLARSVDPRHAAACQRIAAEPVTVDKSDWETVGWA